MTVLCDKTLKRHGYRWILPLRKEHVQPASVDLMLSNQFRVFDPGATRFVDLGDPSTHFGITREVITEEFVLHPGEFILASTEERLELPSGIMARVEGKSSLARLGLLIHATAGFIDPGFQGQVTLEMTSFKVPIILRAGLPICQVSLSEMDEPCENPYDGHYQGQEGATESRYGT